jgi:hypothetical protein
MFLPKSIILNSKTYMHDRDINNIFSDILIFYPKSSSTLAMDRNMRCPLLKGASSRFRFMRLL